MVRTLVAAIVGVALLLGGGVAGYFIGVANDHDRGPGVSRFGDHRPGPPPGFRDGPRQDR
jgi:hypothetical protein